MHIENLYKNQDILLFKECYALEKIHGTSAHLMYNPKTKKLTFFSGGEKHDKFIALFNQEELKSKLEAMDLPIDKTITVFGEAYGGSQQGMSETYGKFLKFIVFDVQIGNCWLDVPKAEKIAKNLGLEFVHYVKVSTDLKELDAQRDAPSVQAIRNGVSYYETKLDTSVPDGVNGPTLINPKKREGVVLRPLIEVTKNNGSRVICKHKGDDFRETTSPRPVIDPEKVKVLADAQAVADEWVTPMRLQHVLDKMPGHSIENMKDIISAMIEDVLRESSGEIVDSLAVRKAISTKTALSYKNYLKSQIGK